MRSSLSVSSTDRWSVQHRSRQRHCWSKTPFSILYGSMVGATTLQPCLAETTDILSVSSTDRWSVQLQAARRRIQARTAFQYPLRIDGRCNPWTAIVLAAMIGSFSILYGSMVGATTHPHWSSKGDLNFQYPLRIDGRCNVDRPAIEAALPPSFSILYGSMVGATCATWRLSTCCWILSVSSTDRWSVQL